MEIDVIKFIEWLMENMELSKTLLRSNAATVVMIAIMISIMLPILIGFSYKCSSFRIRQTLGDEFILNHYTVLGGIILPPIIIIVVLKTVAFIDLLGKTSILAVLSFILGCCLASVLNFMYLIVNIRSMPIPAQGTKSTNELVKFGRKIKYVGKEIIKIFKVAIVSYYTKPKDWDLYLIGYVYLNKYINEKLEKIKISKFMACLLIVWVVSFLTVICLTTYSILKILVV